MNLLPRIRCGIVLLAILLLASACTPRSTTPASRTANLSGASPTAQLDSAGNVSTQKVPGCPLTLAAGGGAAFVGTGCIHSGKGLTSQTLRIVDTDETPTEVLTNAPQLAYIDGSLWAAGVLNHDQPGNVIAKIDATTGEVLTSMHFPGGILDLIAGDASGIWVVGSKGTTSSGTTTRLYQIDVDASKVLQSLPLRGLEPTGSSANRWVADLGVADGSVWVLDLGFSRSGETIADGYVIRISARTGKVTGIVPVGHTNSFTVGAGAVWVTTGDGKAIRIDGRTLKEQKIHLTHFEPFAATEDRVYYEGGYVKGQGVEIGCLDPSTLRPGPTVVEPSFANTVGLYPALDVSTGVAWAVGEDNADLSRIDLTSC